MTLEQGVPRIVPSIFRPYPGVIAAVSTRNGGVSATPFGMNLSLSVGDDEDSVRRNRETFFGSIGISPDALAIPRQVHGTNILTVDHPGLFPDCDGLITSTSGIFLCVTIADCVPVLLFDARSRALGAIHAGWRGVVAGIVRKAVHAMEVELGVRARDLRAYLGPGAGSCCYFVGREVSSKFDPRFVTVSGLGEAVDLKGAAAAQLEDSGLSTENIEISPLCTIDSTTLFHSYRRDGQSSGRMMAVIGKIDPR